jgi:hypothetical protein
METWQHVINTAMLGTEKRSLPKEQPEHGLSAAFDAIHAPGREEEFLQQSAVVFNYRQSGHVPLQIKNISFTEAEAETKPYASQQAHQLLGDIVETESAPLLQYWLELCNQSSHIIQPGWIPALLNTSSRQKHLKTLAFNCCGKRGEWIINFNPAWKFDTPVAEEDTWQTGSPEQRKTLLLAIRKKDAAKARTLLQEVWLQENAASRAELIEALSVHASEEDLPWLEELVNDKSAKVKEQALRIVKTIPASAIVQSYQNILRNSFQLITSKGLPGIGAKQSFEINSITLEDTIVKTGIQPLSNDKNIGDEHYIIRQLIEQVPPSFWETAYNLSAEKTTALFLKQPAQKIFIAALGMAAARFANVEWMRAVIRAEENVFIKEALQLLPQPEAEKYALKFLTANGEADTIFSNLHLFSREWSYEFAVALLRFTAIDI